MMPMAESHLMLAIRHLNYYLEAANGKAVMIPGVVQMLTDHWKSEYSGAVVRAENVERFEAGIPPEPNPDPYAYDCTSCGSKAGKVCFKKDGRMAATPHAPRLYAAGLQ
jgi:hypothetical protein